MPEVQDDQSDSPLPQQIKPSAHNDEMEDLLQIVRKASAASDRETFEELLREQGCSTRWTSTGTLTFILPNGVRIRSARLEQRYNLPPIAAAYGKERRVPESGARYDAAMLIRQVMEQGGDRDELEAGLRAAGYTIVWRPDGSDASITAMGGQRMRLTSLDRTFGLKATERILNGIQHKADNREWGEDRIRRLREAITAAEKADDRDRLISNRSDRQRTRQAYDMER